MIPFTIRKVYIKKNKVIEFRFYNSSFPIKFFRSQFIFNSYRFCFTKGNCAAVSFLFRRIPIRMIALRLGNVILDLVFMSLCFLETKNVRFGSIEPIQLTFLGRRSDAIYIPTIYFHMFWSPFIINLG